MHMPDVTNRVLAGAFLVALASVLYFWGLGQLPFYTVGEPREALEIWEEVHQGEWVLPSRDGVDLPSKPPLFHWLGGLAALAGGDVNELVARVPSAVFATVTVLLVGWAGARRRSIASGVYAASMLASNFEWIRAARSARVDMVLTAFLTAAFLAFETVAAGERPRWRALLLLYFSMALATLSKGPIGLVLPALVGAAYLWLRRDFDRLRHMHLVPGALIAAGLPACWYALAIGAGGAAFVHKQLVVENLMTFFGWTSDPGTPSHSFLYVVPAFLAGFAPWSVFVIPVGIYLYGHRRHLEIDGDLYPLVWFAVVFLFFSVAAGKRTVYLLPAYPAAALLLGSWWARLSAGVPVLSSRLAAALQWVACLAAVLFVMVAVAVIAEARGYEALSLLNPFLHHTDRENLPVVRQIISAHAAAFLFWAGAAVANAAVLIVVSRRRNWRGTFAALLAFVILTSVIVNAVLHPEMAQRRTFKSFMAQVREQVTGTGQLTFYRTFDYGAVFYWHDRIPAFDDRLAEPDSPTSPRYLLIWESEWEQLAAEERSHLQLVGRSDGTGPDGKNRLILAAWRAAPVPDGGHPGSEP